MKKTMFGLFALAVGFACALAFGTFVSLQQGPPGELTIFSQAQTYPAIVAVGLAVASTVFLLGAVAMNDVHRKRSRWLVRAIAFLNSNLKSLLSAVAKALVPMPQYTTSR